MPNYCVSTLKFSISVETLLKFLFTTASDDSRYNSESFFAHM